MSDADWPSVRTVIPESWECRLPGEHAGAYVLVCERHEAEIERLRAENEKHKLLWQEAEKRVFGADMWVRGVTKELETLRANALTAEEAARLYAGVDWYVLQMASSRANEWVDLVLTKLQRIASQNLPSNG